MRFIPLLASAVLIASPLCVGGESDFNLGVDAYKKKDYSQAALQWKRSIVRGNVVAMNNLGFLLYYGYGVSKDLDAAIRLWRTASYAGVSEAQWHLGTAYETGVGIQKDLAKAYAWYRCSIESASAKGPGKTEDAEAEAEILKEAKDSLQRLSEKLSAEELARGQALAGEYVARYGKPAP